MSHDRNSRSTTKVSLMNEGNHKKKVNHSVRLKKTTTLFWMRESYYITYYFLSAIRNPICFKQSLDMSLLSHSIDKRQTFFNTITGAIYCFFLIFAQSFEQTKIFTLAQVLNSSKHGSQSIIIVKDLAKICMHLI